MPDDSQKPPLYVSKKEKPVKKRRAKPEETEESGEAQLKDVLVGLVKSQQQSQQVLNILAQSQQQNAEVLTALATQMQKMNDFIEDARAEAGQAAPQEAQQTSQAVAKRGIGMSEVLQLFAQMKGGGGGQVVNPLQQVAEAVGMMQPIFQLQADMQMSGYQMALNTLRYATQARIPAENVVTGMEQTLRDAQAKTRPATPQVQPGEAK